MRVLRAMMPAADGKPGVSGADKNPARTLGVRTAGKRRDINVDENGMVYPQPYPYPEGMSVSPPPPDNLPEHRRPEEYGGTGTDPVWELDTDSLPSSLIYHPDPKNPDGHGLIGPASVMSVDTYVSLLHATRGLWHLY